MSDHRTSPSPSGHRREVVVVTGGGAGIGAAVAEELGRRGRFVVTMDPLVTLDGAERLAPPGETTADRIVAAGGTAQASSASVTDAEAVHALFADLVAEHGAIDAVVNVAGITRPTSFTRGTDEDWHQVLSVHLDGYLNVLRGALPLMAEAGRGRILGVTSGSGWRPADTGAYGCAKRAVAALTWQLGGLTPAGVTVNAISPIAVTRMVTAALERAQAASGAGGSGSPAGGLSLGSMPTPDELGPIGAHLVDDGRPWLRGRVIFTGGAEVAVVDRPRLVEVVRSDVSSPAALLDAVIDRAWIPAESTQASTGGTNPRFPDAFADGPPPGAAALGPVTIISDRADLAASVAAALQARGVTSRRIAPGVPGAPGAAGESLAAIESVDSEGPTGRVVLALAGPRGSSPAPAWARVLAEHDGIVDHLHLHARWIRAASDLAATTGRPQQVVVLTDGSTAGGRSLGQAVAQLTRAARTATGDLVHAHAVSVEGDRGTDRDAAGALAAHLLCAPRAIELSGAELVVGAGWYGLRTHPRPGGSISYGGPEVPGWFDATLRSMIATE